MIVQPDLNHTFTWPIFFTEGHMFVNRDKHFPLKLLALSQTAETLGKFLYKSPTIHMHLRRCCCRRSAGTYIRMFCGTNRCPYLDFSVNFGPFMLGPWRQQIQHSATQHSILLTMSMRYFSEVAVSTFNLLEWDLHWMIQDTSTTGWKPLLKSAVKSAARSFLPQKVSLLKHVHSNIPLEGLGFDWQPPPSELSSIRTFPISDTRLVGGIRWSVNPQTNVLDP